MQIGGRATSTVGVTSVLLAVGLVTAACPQTEQAKPADSPPATSPTDQTTSPITTDARVYSLTESHDRFDTEAIATYTNRTSRDVFFKRCNNESDGPMHSVVPSGSRRRTIVGVGWACVGGVPTGTISPGRSVTVRVWLGSMKSPGSTPPVQPEDRIGMFHIEFSLCEEASADSDRCRRVPEARRRSSDFEITYA